MLVEECSKELHNRLAREIQEMTTPSVRLEVEKVLYHKMIDFLITCRLNHGDEVDHTPVPNECLTAANFSEPWRKDNSGTNYKPGGQYHCDTDPNKEAHSRRWFRFSGAAGTRLLDTCPPAYSCGSHAGIWTDHTMPSLVGVQSQINVYTSWNDNCKDGIKSLLVMRCSTRRNDLIYKYTANLWCYNAFCGMD